MEEMAKTEPQIIIDPTLDERKLDGYYFIQMYCSNCDMPNGMYDGMIDVMVKEGNLIPKIEFICPNCKCRTLKYI